MGGLSVYDPDIARDILHRIADGESLRSICSGEGMPTRRTVYNWAIDDREGFAVQYNRAREMQAHCFADDVVSIADDARNDWMQRNDPNNPGWIANHEHVQRSRLRTDARKWAAAVILPKIYSEKRQLQNLDKNGDPTDPAVPVVNLTIARE